MRMSSVLRSLEPDISKRHWSLSVTGWLRHRSSLGFSGLADFAIYAALGAGVGLAVAALEWFSIEFLLHNVIEAPTGLQIFLPTVGLLLTAAILRFGWQTSTSTSDEYISAFHGQASLSGRSLLPKLGASISTLGLGGALGMEGPAIYTGASFGQWVAARFPRFSTGTARRALVAAGAAAGVASVFKAPATGVLFALESPYRRDLARHALLPALVASAAAYIVFVLILGTDRLLRFAPAEVALRHEVGGAILLGVLGGTVARYTALVFTWAKKLPAKVEPRIRLPIVGVVLGLAVLASVALVDAPVTLGPGADMITNIALDPGFSVWTIIALFGLRMTATSATLAGGGVGGIFIPLVVQGLLLGRVAEMVVGAPTTGMYPVIGLAAVLGAGYRTPLAAVMFVAETTGRAEYVIPALIATAISQAIMGDRSVSTGQVDERKGRLEHRLGRPVGYVTVTDMHVVSPDDLLTEVIDGLSSVAPTPAVPVFDGSSTHILVLSDIAIAIFEHGEEARVRHAMRDVPSVHRSQPAMEAARLMNDHNCAAIVVIGDYAKPIGIVSAESLAGLSDIEADEALS